MMVVVRVVVMRVMRIWMRSHLGRQSRPAQSGVWHHSQLDLVIRVLVLGGGRGVARGRDVHVLGAVQAPTTTPVVFTTTTPSSSTCPVATVVF